MKMTAYARDTRIQTRANCILSIKDIVGVVKAEEEAHTLRIAELKARINECQVAIDRITTELADC